MYGIVVPDCVYVKVASSTNCFSLLQRINIMANIPPVAHQIFLILQRIIDINRLQYVRDAVVGGETEMKQLLSVLPGDPVRF